MQDHILQPSLTLPRRQHEPDLLLGLHSPLPFIFDLIIADIAMPEMDGLQLLAELRRRPHSARWPAIAVTGFASGADAQRAKAAGFDAHLGKPLSLEALNEAFKQINGRTTPS
jgi:CheY-like chemotaxis protein